MAPPSPSKVWPITTLLLRLFTFLFLMVSIILLATDNVKVRDSSIRFKDIFAYRYLLSTVVIGCAYILLQIPLGVYFMSMGTRLGGDGLLYFDFYADKIMVVLLASGIGAGFGVTGDLKKQLDDLFKEIEAFCLLDLDQIVSKLNKFFGMADIATGFLLLALLCTFVLSIGSSLALTKRGLFG